jgi:hypothetical protein
MTQRPPAPKPCPTCGIAMVASKSDERRADNDVFTCLNCDFVLTLSAPPKRNRGATPAEIEE